MIQDIEKISGRIDRCFFVDVFQAITRMAGVQPRNELELSMRNLERLQTLGPFIELFETEFADPAIHRVLAILDRRRMLKPKPKSLANIPLKIEYISMIRQAQQGAASVGLDAFRAAAGEASTASLAAKQGGTAIPDPLRVVNWDKWLRRKAELENVDTDILFTEDEVKAQDQAAAEAHQQAAVPGQAMAAVEAAQTLSKTPIGGGTALSGILGTGGQPQAGAGA
jgi:hypothetical protein